MTHAIPGHNNPPEPTPFELSRDEIEGLYMEAKNWCDGSPVQDQAQADAIGKLINDLRLAEKTADAQRRQENRPFDEGRAAVQTRYNPLIHPNLGKAYLAIAACKQALVPFLEAQETARRVKAAAARQEADAKAKSAQDALRASQGDLAARELAEASLRDAKAADQAATRLEAERPGARGGGRAVTAREAWKATLTDRREAARFLWTECPEQFDALLLKLGQDFVDAGRRTLLGFDVSPFTSVQ